jgi:hypothetical protein
MINKIKQHIKIIALFALGNANAYAQQPDKTVIYTLKEGERIIESKFSFQNPEIKYYCLVENSTSPFSEKVSLIVNGNLIAKKSAILKAGENVPYINVYDVKKSCYKYVKNNEVYLHYEGENYGPYEDVELKPTNLSNKYVIVYKKDGKNYVILPDSRLIGPVDKQIHKLYLAPESKTYFFITYKNDKYDGYFNIFYNGKYITNYNSRHVITEHPYIYFNKNGDCIFSIFDKNTNGINICINGNRIAQNCDYKNCLLTEKGKYAYAYYSNNNEYLNVNGSKTYNGYNKITGFDINDKNGVIYRYIKDGKDYVSLNGKILGVYDNTASFIVNSDNISFILTKEWETDEIFPNKVFIKNNFTTPSINNNGDYIYAYRYNGKFYIQINGKSEGPYQETWRPFIDELGNYAYWCKIDNKQYIIRNGKKEGEFDNVSLPAIKNGKYAYTFTQNNKWYVNINGSKNGPYDIIENNNNLENDGLFYFNDEGQYAYTFFNGNIQCACINNKEYIAPKPTGFFYFEPNVQNGFGFKYFVEIFGGYHNNKESFLFDQNNKIIKQDIDNNIGDYGIQNFYSSNGNNQMQCNARYSHVVINGNNYGEARALSATYNEWLNVFRWSAIENNELVFYEYKIR